ncbi:hypothetical protein MRX96_044923 [Rhipicephalus microplus]
MTTSKVSAGMFEWTQPVPRETWNPRDPALLKIAERYEQVEQAIGYSFRDKGWLLMAFTHESMPAMQRIVPATMYPTNLLGDAWLRYFLSAKLYGSMHPLCPRSLNEATSHVVAKYSLGLAAVRHGWHRLLYTGSARLDEDIANYVCSIQNTDYPGDRAKVPPKVLADAFGALIGAVYLDSNHDMAASWHALYSVLRPHIDYEVTAVAAKSALYFF